MYRSFLCFVVCLFTASTVWGQAAYNPYAPQEEDPSPVRFDGKLNWPTFYKSTATQAKYQSYFEMGSCVGTKKMVNDKLADNKVNVNKLPEVEVGGKSVQSAKGAFTMLDTEGESATVVVHPAGVSKVSITGPMPLTGLAPGMAVRFLSKVDTHGHGTETLKALEVVTPTADVGGKEVVANKLTTIMGTIVKLHGDQIHLKLTAGKLRKLVFVVTSETAIEVNSSDVSLISPGDEVKATGHVYVGAGITTQKQIFATEVTVTKVFNPVAEKVAHELAHKSAGR